MNDEFYVGYGDAKPAGLARHARRWIAGVAVVVVAMAVVLGLAQRRADPGSFEYGTVREFVGVFREFPLPRLQVDGGAGGATNLLLVGAGKHGLPAFAAGHDGERMALRGTSIERGGVRMVEANDPGSVRFLGRLGADLPAPRVESLGEVRLSGELVDTKCWLGVMRPATGKVHRACAVRCLSGGVPPGLLLRDSLGNAVVVFLADERGGPARVDPQWGGRRMTVDGVLELVDGTAVLRGRRFQPPRD